MKLYVSLQRISFSSHKLIEKEGITDTFEKITENPLNI